MSELDDLIKSVKASVDVVKSKHDGISSEMQNLDRDIREAQRHIEQYEEMLKESDNSMDYVQSARHQGTIEQLIREQQDKIKAIEQRKQNLLIQEQAVKNEEANGLDEKIAFYTQAATKLQKGIDALRLDMQIALQRGVTDPKYIYEDVTEERKAQLDEMVAKGADMRFLETNAMQSKLNQLQEAINICNEQIARIRAEFEKKAQPVQEILDNTYSQKSEPTGGQQPSGNGQNPPPAGTQQPGDNGQTPPPSGQQPGDNGQTPPPSGQQPGDNGQTPPSGQQPGDNGQTPPPSGQQPGDNGQTPPSGQQPGDNGQTPPSGQQPGDNGQTPPAGQQPGDNGQNPPSGQQPGDNGQTPPPAGTQQPGDNGQNPPSGQQPGDNGQNPPSGQQQGNNGQNQEPQYRVGKIRGFFLRIVQAILKKVKPNGLFGKFFGGVEATLLVGAQEVLPAPAQTKEPQQPGPQQPEPQQNPAEEIGYQDSLWAKDKIDSIDTLDKNSLMYQILTQQFKQLVADRQGKSDDELQRIVEEKGVPQVYKSDKGAQNAFQNILAYRVKEYVIKSAEDKNIETKDKDGNPRSIEEIYADLEKKYLQEKTNQTSRQAAENQQQSEEPDKQPEDQEK